MDFSVGDFAEKLLAKEQLQGNQGNDPAPFTPTESFYSADVTQQAPDISEIEVSNDFVNSIVEDKQLESDLIAISPAIVESPTSMVPEVDEFTTLLKEVRDLLKDVSKTLVEMTSVGMGIGAPGAGAPTKEKKKDEEEDTYTELLKRIKRKKAAR